MAKAKGHRECAVLVGKDAKGSVVYQKTISIHDYYDQLHPWDDTNQVKQLKMVSLFGKLFDMKGRVLQEFETAYEGKTGKYLGGRAKFDDGTITCNGVFAVKSRKRSK